MTKFLKINDYFTERFFSEAFGRFRVSILWGKELYSVRVKFPFPDGSGFLINFSKNSFQSDRDDSPISVCDVECSAVRTDTIGIHRFDLPYEFWR